MYLDNVLIHSESLIDTAVKFHQEGKIPPNSWVIDLDTIADNAEILANKAKSLGLTTYVMSKQHNRNPYINAIACHKGLNKIVAVDATCAILCERYGIPLGHAGHLNQIPRHLLPKVIGLRPDVITIYSSEHAKFISDEAVKQGIVQDLLLRVFRDGDIHYEGQEGGFDLTEIPAIVEATKNLPGVKIVGVTAFPCLKYNANLEDPITLTPNMTTVQEAVKLLESLGIEIKQINTPANTNSQVMELLKSAGATHVEPGNGLLGTTPNHAFSSDLPEKTAFIWLSEVTHFFKGDAYAIGGGLYHAAYADTIEVLVGSTGDSARANKAIFQHEIVQGIDYHMVIRPGEKAINIGDSVVAAYRTQMHMTRSYIVPISGLSGKRPLKIHPIFDNAGNCLGENLQPIPVDSVKSYIAELLKSY